MTTATATTATTLRLFVDALADLGIEWQPILRYGEDLALVPIPAGKTATSVSVMYGSV